jgi:hypothetical protein
MLAERVDDGSVTPAESGVVIPVNEGSSRSSSALGRAVVADALRTVDPVGARQAEGETNWRSGYPQHFRRLVEAGLPDAGAAHRIAADGMASLHRRMRLVRPDGVELGLGEAFDAGDDHELLQTVTLDGSARPEPELSLPYRGQRLRGDALQRRLDTWVTSGVIEPSCAEAVRTVMANPQWLDLSDQRVVVLGAGAQMGPTRSILRWGGEVVAVDLPRRQLWARLLRHVEGSAGRLLVPARRRVQHPDLAERAGADLLHELPALAGWLDGFDGRLVLGNYVYADGVAYLRVAMATDALTERLRRSRPDAALAFLATPTDVYAVPAEAVRHAEQAYRRSRARWLRTPLGVLSGGRLLRRAYPPGADPGVSDSLVLQQGPNYALAKRLQRWRATVARTEGAAVSLLVAPPTRTASVLTNRALTAAYAGAHHFGVEVFEPATSNTLLAALLVHDLRTECPAGRHPWQDEAAAAAHGGLWRTAYAPRSSLGLAALVGFLGGRG